jgi:hypothetical protein
MRRCYSTKPIEEVESELEQKGMDYWKYLISRALQDKSLDVIEHFCMELLFEGFAKEEMAAVQNAFPFLHFLEVGVNSCLVSLNARTLVEMWRDVNHRGLARVIVDLLRNENVGLGFASLASGE